MLCGRHRSLQPILRASQAGKQQRARNSYAVPRHVAAARSRGVEEAKKKGATQRKQPAPCSVVSLSLAKPRPQAEPWEGHAT